MLNIGKDIWMLTLHAISLMCDFTSAVVWGAGLFLPSPNHLLCLVAFYDMLIAIEAIIRYSCNIDERVCNLSPELSLSMQAAMMSGAAFHHMGALVVTFLLMRHPYLEWKHFTVGRARWSSMLVGGVFMTLVGLGAISHTSMKTVVGISAAILIVSWFILFLFLCFTCEGLRLNEHPAAVANSKERSMVIRMRRAVYICLTVISFFAVIVFFFAGIHLVLTYIGNITNFSNYVSNVVDVALPLGSILNFSVYFAFIPNFRWRLTCQTYKVNRVDLENFDNLLMTSKRHMFLKPEELSGGQEDIEVYNPVESVPVMEDEEAEGEGKGDDEEGEKKKKKKKKKKSEVEEQKNEMKEAARRATLRHDHVIRRKSQFIVGPSKLTEMQPDSSQDEEDEEPAK